MSAYFLGLQVCDVMQFRDDHAHMRIRGPVTLVAYSKLKQCNKVIVLRSYVEAILILEILGHIFGDKVSFVFPPQTTPKTANT